MDFDLEQASSFLQRTPSTLSAMLEGMPDAWTDASEGPGTWSSRTVVAHLLHADQTNWIPRANVILRHGRTVQLPAFDPNGQFQMLGGMPMGDLLSAFARVRAASLHALAAMKLGEESLAREGEHPVLGRVTLGQLLAAWVAHDLSHILQVTRVLARQYRTAVGPWCAYLPILERHDPGDRR